MVAAMHAATHAVIAALTGCSSVASGDDASTPAVVEKSEAPSPTPTWTTVHVGKLPDLTFEGGASIASDAVTQWSDGLVDEQGWLMSSPDDGHGSWAYTTVDGDCVATFWQGSMAGMDTEDDRLASDIVLATLIGGDPAGLQDKISSGTFSHDVSSHGSVDNRFMHGTFDDGMTWALAARGFAQTGSAVYVDVQCRELDALEVAGFVWNENAVRVD